MKSNPVLTFEKFQELDIPDVFTSHFSDDGWGQSIYIISAGSAGIGRLYMFNDEPSTVYLDSLSVHPTEREKGLGLQLQEIRESIGKQLGATRSMLWVRKKSWMFEWYQRRDYVAYKPHTDEPDCVWMIKDLV